MAEFVESHSAAAVVQDGGDETWLLLRVVGVLGEKRVRGEGTTEGDEGVLWSE